MKGGRSARHGIAIEAEGPESIIKNNLLINTTCGILFQDASGEYGENVIIQSDEGVCGKQALDSGHNVVPATTCGNAVRSVDEACEGTDLGTATCVTLGFLGGNLLCNDLCKFDTSGCL